MWFRVFLGSWSLFLTVFFIWLANHQSAEGEFFGRYSEKYFVLLLGVGGLVLLSVGGQLKPVFAPLYRFRKEIVLLFASAGISLVAVDSIIRVADPLGISYFQES